MDEQFKLLLTENYRRIYAYIVTLVPHTPDADDIFQETSLLMFQRFSEFQPGSNFSAWAIKIASFKIMELRKKQRKSKMILNDESYEIISNLSVERMDTVDDRSKALDGCIKKLAKEDVYLINRRYGHSEKISDIAMGIDKPVKNLYYAFTRIHNTLRACIKNTLLSLEESHGK